MKLTLAYRRRSSVVRSAAGLAVALAPNLRRDRVSFRGKIRDPLLMREALGALHDVVVSDLTFKPRDHSAYQAILAERHRLERQRRTEVIAHARAEIGRNLPDLPEPIPPEFERRYKRLRGLYWDARLRYSNYLSKHDPLLWRLLVPCDPVITIAPDVLFFECFSSDESSYACLTVDRSMFEQEEDVSHGTTNVDYSWTLYEHFQSMRTYQETRFLVDPTGFGIETGESDGYREEKIDLPPSWLRGFLQLQAAMTLPSRQVPIARVGLYNILAFLGRNRAARGPRAIRVELEPGKPPSALLEPWDRRVRLGDEPYLGVRPEVIRIWGRDRLRLLARLLPMMDRAELYLLGSGLPSFWSVTMGPVRFLLGLSGWTANDWSAGSALDQISPLAEPDAETLTAIATAFRASPALTYHDLARASRARPAELAVGLNRLALLGQIIHDLPSGLFRWRQVMPVTLSSEVIGPEHPETQAARQIVAERRVKVTRDEGTAHGMRILEGKILGSEFSLLLDADGRMLRGKCSCSYQFTGGLRRGPCRHLQALRTTALLTSDLPRTPPEGWFRGLQDSLS